MSNIVSLSNVFNYQKTITHPIRNIMQDGEPWFVAADVCEALDISNVSQAVENLDDDEKLLYPLHIAGQNRNILFVDESGLYHLIFQSRKEEAKDFRRWVTKEVLPSIRKTGSYALNGPKLLRPNPQQYLSPVDEETLILRYVERLENPTARDLSRYLKRFPVAEIRLQLRDLTEQGKIREWFTGHSYRYKITK